MNLRSSAALLLAFAALPVCAAQAPKAVQKTAAAAGTVTVTGTLVEKNLDAGFVPPTVFPVAVGPDEEQADTVTVTTEALNQYSGKVDKTGAFRLRVPRSFVPAGKKLRLMVMFVDDRRLQSIKVKGQNAVFSLDAKTTTLSLGKVTTK